VQEFSTGDRGCGRYSIDEPADHCPEGLVPEQLVIHVERYNVTPTTRVEMVKMWGTPAEQSTGFEVGHTLQWPTCESARVLLKAHIPDVGRY